MSTDKITAESEGTELNLGTNDESLTNPIGEKYPRHNKRRITKKKVRDTVFYWSIAALPLIMLFVNVFYINLNTVILAFKKLDETGNYVFAGFDNFISVIQSFKTDAYMLQSLKNSLILYALSLVIGTIIPLFISYYLYKKLWLTKFFKVVLFLPSIVSSMATVIMYKFVVDRVAPAIFPSVGAGLLSEPGTQFWTIMFFYFWLSICGYLVTVGAMNAADKSVVEAGRLDGLGFFGELWHIVLPASYKVIFINLYMGIAAIFTADYGLYTFFGQNASSNVSTLGYYFYVLNNKALDPEYPYLAAWGLMATCIVVPLTFLVRKLMYKIGPKED